MSEAQIQQYLKEIVSKTLDRYRQELAGENEDLLDHNLRTYGAKIARISNKVAQKWSKWAKEGPVLMPDYTRIYYRKGKNEAVLQEYPPHVRLMRFRGSLVSRNASDEEIEVLESDKIYTFSLALPYVIFIFKFHDGLFTELKCAFSDRPLKRLEEKPLRPYLTNIDNTLKVCLGMSLDRGALERNNIAQQAALVLDNFWQTVYTDEWSENFWKTHTHFLETKEERLSSLRNWETATIDNSLFVIEDVDWLRHEQENFGEVIIGMLEGDQDYNRFSDDLYKDLSENFVEEVKKSLGTNLETAAQKVLTSGLNQILTDSLAKEG